MWTTDKDGILAALLSAEITARLGRDSGEVYDELTAELGKPFYARKDAPATQAKRSVLNSLSAEHMPFTEPGGEGVQAHVPGSGTPIDGVKVETASAWFAARPSGTEDAYKIYAESFLGAEHLNLVLKEAQTVVDDALRESAE